MKTAKIQFTITRLKPVKTMTPPAPANVRNTNIGAEAAASVPVAVPTIGVTAELQSTEEGLRGALQLQFRDRPDLLALLDSATTFTVEIRPAP